MITYQGRKTEHGIQVDGVLDVKDADYPDVQVEVPGKHIEFFGSGDGVVIEDDDGLFLATINDVGDWAECGERWLYITVN